MNKSIKKITIFSFLLISVTVSVLSLNPSEKAITSFSKEQLFNAIFFLEGELVNEIPALKKIRNYIESDNNAEIDLQGKESIITMINDMDSEFMNRLYNEVLSKDHHEISSTIKEGTDLILLSKVIIGNNSNEKEKFPNISWYNLKNKSDRNQALSSIRNFFDNQTEVAVSLGCYLAITYVHTLWTYVNIWIHDEMSNSLLEQLKADESISHEVIVNQLSILRK